MTRWRRSMPTRECIECARSFDYTAQVRGVSTVKREGEIQDE
jgi:hypothetical protein